MIQSLFCCDLYETHMITWLPLLHTGRNNHDGLYFFYSFVTHIMSPKCRGSSGEGLFVKEGQEHGRGKGKAVYYGKKKRFKSKDRRTAKCYGCKQISHWKRDCSNKSDSNSSTNAVQSDGSCGEEDLLCISSTKCIDAWILDSGCFYHLTPYWEWSNSFKSGDFGIAYLGDDKTCTIIRKGKIKFSLDDGGAHTLSEVCYVL